MKSLRVRAVQLAAWLGRSWYKPHVLYVAVAIVWGVVQLSVLPPYMVPDEPAHYNRAWGIAQGEIFCRPGSIVNVPKEVLTFFNAMEVHIGYPGSYRFADAAAFRQKKFAGELVNLYTPACAYNPISYIPAALAIDIVKLFEPSPFYTFYAARIATMFIAIGLTAWAIKRTPFGKWVFAVVALLPMTVQQFASVNADALTISSLFLFTAIVFSYLQKLKLTTKDLIWLTVAALLLVPLKPVYLPLLGLVLLLRPKMYGSVKRYVTFLAVFTALNVLLAFGLYKLFSVAVPLAPSTAIHPSVQISAILQNPAEVVRFLHNDLLNNATVYIFGMLGVPGWLHFAYPNGFYFFILAGLAFVLISFEREVKLLPAQRALLIGLSYVSVMAFSIFMFVYWTVPEATTLDGIQGRYYLPLLPLVLVAVCGITLTKLSRTLLMLGFVVLIGTNAIGGVYSFYYLEPYQSTVPAHRQKLLNDFKNVKLINLKRLHNDIFVASTDDPMMVMTLGNAVGYAFVVVATGPMEIRYKFSGDADWDPNHVDTIKLPGIVIDHGFEPRHIDLDIPLLEKEVGRKVEQVRIDPTDKAETFHIRQFDTYLP